MGAAVLAAPVAGQEPFAASREHFERIPEFLSTLEARRMNHSEMERELEQRSRELARQLYQDWLTQQTPAQAEGPVVDCEGKQRTRTRIQERELETVFGTVSVQRTGYGVVGEASLHPFDGRLNLPRERYSLQVRRRAAEESAKNSFDEAVQTLTRYTGAHVPKRQVEQLTVQAAQDFDAFYEVRRRQAAQTSPEAPDSLLVITGDAKGVVMHKQDLRPATRKAAQNKHNKLHARLSKGEKPYRKRMAMVGAVYTVAPYVRTAQQVLRVLARSDEQEEDRPTRPKPQHKRVWATLHKEPHQVLQEAFLEAQQRDPSLEKTWVCVVDGNKTQLRSLKQLHRQYQVPLTIVVDLIHVLEYLWKAAHAFVAEGSAELEQWVFQRLLRILQGQASQVAAGMRRSATKRHLPKKRRAPVDRCANYLLKYKAYLAYDRYLAHGMPIATGVIEGACRHLVKDRMDLTGARWRLTSAEAVLRLRALRASNDFDEYWRFHEAQEYQRNHPPCYADGQVPPILEPSTSRLRLIK